MGSHEHDRLVGLVGEVVTCGPGGSPRLARTRR
jgi:hypothetical protein